MGIIIPQVITRVQASGAQVIDGSLKFDSDAKTIYQELQVLQVTVERGLGVVG